MNPYKSFSARLFREDIVLMNGKKRKASVCTALFDEYYGKSNMQVNMAVRKNLSVCVADVVTGVTYHMESGSMFRQSTTQSKVSLRKNFDVYLKPYFLGEYPQV